MARPIKEGFDYFSLDTDFMQNIKVRRICKACGPHSMAVLISLLCNIYREHGYYIGWDNDMPFLIADEVGISEGSVLEVIKKAIQVSFFDEEMATNKQILTSRDIQERYTRICMEAKRRRWGIQQRFSLMDDECKRHIQAIESSKIKPPIEEYSEEELLPEETTTPTQATLKSTQLLPSIKTQRKEKERKEKEIHDADSKTDNEALIHDETPFGYESSSIIPIEDIFQTVTNPQGQEYPWLKHVASMHHLSGPELGSHLVEFCKHLKASGIDRKRLKDFKQHFNSWVRIQLSINQKSASEGDSNYWENINKRAKQKIRSEQSPHP